MLELTRTIMQGTTHGSCENTLFSLGELGKPGPEQIHTFVMPVVLTDGLSRSHFP